MSTSAINLGTSYIYNLQHRAQQTPVMSAQPQKPEMSWFGSPLLQSTLVMPENYGRAQVAIQTPMSEPKTGGATPQEALEVPGNTAQDTEKAAIKKLLEDPEFSKLMQSYINSLDSKDPDYKTSKAFADLIVIGSELQKSSKTGENKISDIALMQSFLDNELIAAFAPEEAAKLKPLQPVLNATAEAAKKCGNLR